MKRAVLALAVLAPLASANTYIVDRSGGGQFADIQLAILASSPGDVLLVQPGTYGPFTLDRGVTIIGYGNCNVAGPIGVLGVPFEQTAALVRIEATNLDIQGCPGHVLVQDVQHFQRITVSDSLDVRFARITAPDVYGFPPAPAATVSNSRLEIVSSWLHGQDGAISGPPAADGASGIECTGARLHFARSTLWGGRGADMHAEYTMAGNGGYALKLSASSQAIVCGLLADELDSGYYGLNFYYSDCDHDGISGPGVYLGSASLLRISNVTLHAWPYYTGHQCFYNSGVDYVFQGGTLNQPPLSDPTLTVSGNPAAGGAQAFTLDAPAGSAAVLSFGTWPVVQTDPSTVIEWLVQPQHNVSLGVVGAGGSATFTWPIPSGMRKGATIYAQAHVTLPGGEIRRTNSVPVIVR